MKDEIHSLSAERLFCVKGLVTIVTGAASGLGLTIAETMAANGADLILVDRNEKEMKRVSEEVIPGAETAVVDIADPAAIRRLVDGVVQRKGRLDVVFANAGISAGGGGGGGPPPPGRPPRGGGGPGVGAPPPPAGTPRPPPAGPP
ncbi:SDR family NAD(P)-dependent oxidoreductase, partial [Rhodopseudomonas sp. BAL398]|uniref:SDR family oxidoreductase n=1 Tax=Rhodopseudomonas sp. BAL398 TaxID=3034676 RepID=UPI0023E18876